MEINAQVVINVLSVLIMLIMFFWKKNDRYQDKEKDTILSDIKDLKKGLHETNGRVTKIEFIQDSSKSEIAKIHDTIKEMQKINTQNIQTVNETKSLVEGFKDFLIGFMKKD